MSGKMRLEDFDYNLPKELIANSHIEPRDHSRLLIFDRKNGEIEHKHFYDIVDYLDQNSVLVFNDSKVFKARIYGNKKTGGKIELLLIRPENEFEWQALLKGKVKPGDQIKFSDEILAEIVNKEDKVCTIKFNKNSSEIFQYLEKKGELPLPPYVEVKSEKLKVKSDGAASPQTSNNVEESSFYQNCYAENIGSVAAPTAGFHFTPELIEKIKSKGVDILHITLHVGPGTFLPVECEDVENHKMHEEFFEVKKETWEKILQAKKDGKKIVAVGTTTCRTLEAIAKKTSYAQASPLNILDSSFMPARRIGGIHDSSIIDSTNIFIYPPYKFQIVDQLITNFHLPKSTLLMLVSAFVAPNETKGTEPLKNAYKKAADESYRFFSFGDSMFLK